MLLRSFFDFELGRRLPGEGEITELLTSAAAYYSIGNLNLDAYPLPRAYRDVRGMQSPRPHPFMPSSTPRGVLVLAGSPFHDTAWASEVSHAVIYGGSHGCAST